MRGDKAAGSAGFCTPCVIPSGSVLKVLQAILPVCIRERSRIADSWRGLATAVAFRFVVIAASV